MVQCVYSLVKLVKFSFSVLPDIVFLVNKDYQNLALASAWSIWPRLTTPNSTVHTRTRLSRSIYLIIIDEYVGEHKAKWRYGTCTFEHQSHG